MPVHETVAALSRTPQVEWYLERPALLALEVSYRRELARASSDASAPPKRPA